MAEKRIINSITDRIKVRVSLIKFSISLMSAAAAITGYSMGLPLLTGRALLTGAGVFCIAAGSSVMNNYQDRNTDSKMERTKRRPLPLGEISPGSAVAQSLLLITAGTAILIVISDSFLPAVSGILAVFLYNGIYTHFKKHIFLSFFSGIMCGMLSPLIGWFSAGGLIPSVQVVYFMVLMGVWQVPHTWLILLRYRDDYSKAGISTVVDFFSEDKLRYILLLWVIFYASLILFAKLFFNNIPALLSILLIVNAVLIIAVFFTNLIIRKSDGVYNMLFHQFNFSMMCVILITTGYALYL